MPKPFKLTAPRPFVPKEFTDQERIFAWAQWCKLDGVDLLYATLNGVRLPIGLAKKMKRAGLKAGPLDLNLDVARGSYHGFRCELKRAKGGVVSAVQLAWIERLREEGYYAAVARGADQCIDLLKWYLSLPKTAVIPFDPGE